MPIRHYDSLIMQELTTYPTKTFEEIGDTVGLSSKTIANRIKDPDFQAELWTTHRKIVRASYFTLCRSSQEAIATLVELLDDKNPNVRHRAATTILNLISKFRVEVDLEERVSILEKSALNQARTRK